MGCQVHQTARDNCLTISNLPGSGVFLATKRGITGHSLGEKSSTPETQEAEFSFSLEPSIGYPHAASHPSKALLIRVNSYHHSIREPALGISLTGPASTVRCATIPSLNLRFSRLNLRFRARDLRFGPPSYNSAAPPYDSCGLLYDWGALPYGFVALTCDFGALPQVFWPCGTICS